MIDWIKPDGWYFVEQRGEVPRNMEEAIEFHIDSMRKDGDPIPEPTTGVAYAEVA